MMWLYILLIFVLAFYYWWRNYVQLPCANYPPGPMGLPLLGYLPIITEENILAGLDKAHDQYGDVISVNLGPSPRMVVIGDYDLLKEAFKDDKPAARPPEMMWFNTYFRGGNGHDSRGLLFSKVCFYCGFDFGVTLLGFMYLVILREQNGLNREDLH
jgi:hypothetical protein